MEDLLELIVGAVFEVSAEVLSEIVLAAITALVARAFRKFRVSVRRGNPIVASVVFVLLGVALGFLSVLAFPHPLVHPSRVHGISLLVSPVITGLLLGFIGRSIRRRGKVPVQIESFTYGFLFAFPLALIRLLALR